MQLMCICLRSLVYCWTNILLNRLELLMTNNSTGIRVKENKGRACLSPSLLITIFYLLAYLQPCRDRVCCRSLVLFSVVLTSISLASAHHQMAIGLVLGLQLTATDTTCDRRRVCNSSCILYTVIMVLVCPRHRSARYVGLKQILYNFYYQPIIMQK